MQTSIRRDGSVPGAQRPGVTQKSVRPAAGKTNKGAQPVQKKAKRVAEVSLHPCSTVPALPDDALHVLLWSAQHWSSELVATSLPSDPSTLLAAFFLQLRFAHVGICQQMCYAAQPSRSVCLTMCHSMPEQRCYHLQGKAAQTKRGPAPRAVAPVKVNAKPAVRQSATSTRAVQVGQRAVRQWCYCMPSGFITPAMHCLEQSYPGEGNARNASACQHSKQLSCAPF